MVSSYFIGCNICEALLEPCFWNIFAQHSVSYQTPRMSSLLGIHCTECVKTRVTPLVVISETLSDNARTERGSTQRVC
jgi:hypothetical protein